MSVKGSFNPASGPKPRTTKTKRPAPFSLRLSAEERARLVAEGNGAPLGAYIKAKVLSGTTKPVRTRRTGLPIYDRKVLAKALALLGNSRIASNIKQLARAANIGALPVTRETEAELVWAAQQIRELRALLIVAMDVTPEEVLSPFAKATGDA
jgi:hypothetical protein